MTTLICSLSWVCTGGFILFFLILARKSNILRDAIDNPAAFIRNAAINAIKYENVSFDKIPRPFSLARSQFACWTLIITSAYLEHFLCRDCVIPLSCSSTALALLSISAGTAAIANIIDRNDAMAGLMIPRHQNTVSQGFFYDILSDASGISIHRFQHLIWTIVAMIIFCCRAAKDICALPGFDSTILALTGISSAAYLGLKLNENK